MILYRHIIRGLIIPFIYSLAIIIFIFTMQLAVQLLGKILYKGLDWYTILELFLVNSAWMIVLAVPMSVLAATLICFGRMSADNEILAIKASGQNLLYMITPVMAAACMLTVLLIFFHNLILPDANHRSANLMSDISRKKPAALIEPNILIQDFENYSIIVEEVRNRTGGLRGVKIFSDVPGEEPATTVADSGIIQLTKDEKYLQLTLFDGETHNRSKNNPDEYYVVRFKKHMIFIPNIDSRLQRTERFYRGDREKSAEMLMVDVREFRQTKAQALEEYTRTLHSLFTSAQLFDSLRTDSNFISKGNLDSIHTYEQWLASLSSSQPGALRQMQKHVRFVQRTIQQIDRQNQRISQYLVEVHKKYSVSFACIVFIFIGIPLGIAARSGNIAAGASYSIFIFILYWAFLIGGENLADRLIVPPEVAMWSCNAVIGLFGIFLTMRMVRESSVINYEPVLRLWHRLTSFRKTKPHSANVISRVLFCLPTFILNKTVGILPSYLIRSFLANVLLVFLALIVIFVVIDYISNLRLFETARFEDIVLYYWYYLAWFISLIFPIGILLASMFAMTSLAKHSELTAMKAAGISVRRLTMPMLFFGLLISVASFFIGEKFLPQANDNRKQITEDLRTGRREIRGQPSQFSMSDYRRNFYYFGNKNTAYRFDEFRVDPLLARKVRRDRFDNNRIVETIQAENLVLQNQRQWLFVKGQRKVFQNNTFILTPFDSLADSVLTATPLEMTARIKSVDAMSYWELKRMLENAQKRGEKISKYEADLHFKIALPFLNFIVILIGLSVTARSGRKGGSVSFGIGLGLVFAFWILSQFVLALGKNETLEPWLAAWLVNIVSCCIGLFLYQKASE